MASITSQRIIRRPRSFLRVNGPDAADYLQRMLSNDVEALGVGDSCDALLLTAKARLIAPLRVRRRGERPNHRRHGKAPVLHGKSRRR